MEKAIIVLADGFEEIEAISVIDILRRAHMDVTVAGLKATCVTSARNIKVNTDTCLSDCTALYDIVILPGGEPGTTNLENSPLIPTLLKKHADAKKWIAAICAAPRILNKEGYLKNKTATSHPGTKEKMTQCHYSEDAVVVDGTIITSRGPGTATQFAFTIIEKLQSKEAAETIKKTMVFL